MPKYTSGFCAQHLGKQNKPIENYKVEKQKNK